MAFDLATAQQVTALAAKVDRLLTLLEQPAASSTEPLLTVDEVAEYTKFDRRTVEAWPREGRYDHRGKLVYLPVLEFNGRLRFKRADVEAFGLKVGVLTPSTTGGKPEATKAPKKPKKSKNPVASEAALRVA